MFRHHGAYGGNQVCNAFIDYHPPEIIEFIVGALDFTWRIRELSDGLKSATHECCKKKKAACVAVKLVGIKTLDGTSLISVLFVRFIRIWRPKRTFWNAHRVQLVLVLNWAEYWSTHAQLWLSRVVLVTKRTLIRRPLNHRAPLLIHPNGKKHPREEDWSTASLRTVEAGGLALIQRHNVSSCCCPESFKFRSTI